jgi:hypothetical protein
LWVWPCREGSGCACNTRSLLITLPIWVVEMVVIVIHGHDTRRWKVRFIESEPVNPFVVYPMTQAHPIQWEVEFKLDIPEFQGCLQLEEFLDWMVLSKRFSTLRRCDVVFYLPKYFNNKIPLTIG